MFNHLVAVGNDSNAVSVQIGGIAPAAYGLLPVEEGLDHAPVNKKRNRSNRLFFNRAGRKAGRRGSVVPFIQIRVD